MTIRGILFDAADIFYARDDTVDHYALLLMQERGHPGHVSDENIAFLKALQDQASIGRIGYETYW